MKKTLIALCILFVGFNVQAQGAGTEEDKAKAKKVMEMMSKKVDIDVDETLFTAVTPNTYVSESPKAVIMTMMVPETYAASKEKMNENETDKFKVTDRGEKEINGVKVLYMTGTSEAEGTTLNNTIYCVEYDAETCIMFIGMVEEGADKKYTDAVAKAANSVIKKK
ncbi:hypothetical protein IMCC3317_43840 [Kordia antarctica]|uniref:DUF4252 domain-containing protein n=1 Tax=Kordia antarctica TaxID=1218801 RepID=A0A7L4ZU10_9FLAO|nr:hypothetical protein [Kordia antarctica]QHI38984.1 hypothetical protein IMCC3317_43840 [Kordia antarctica]